MKNMDLEPTSLTCAVIIYIMLWLLFVDFDAITSKEDIT